MNFKLIKETIGAIVLGDALMGMIAPQRYSLIWKIGPKNFRKAMENLYGARFVWEKRTSAK